MIYKVAQLVVFAIIMLKYQFLLKDWTPPQRKRGGERERERRRVGGRGEGREGGREGEREGERERGGGERRQWKKYTYMYSLFHSGRQINVHKNTHKKR